MAAAKGYSMKAGPEAEFFLFQTKNGIPTTESHDAASYFDLSPVDMGEDVRREIVLALEAMGFHVEAAHHEVAPGQHEIDFRYDDVLTTADSVTTFRFVVKNVAIRNGLHATFMPKPVYGINGSGMHTHMSLFSGGTNIFFDPKAPRQLSEVPQLHRGICATPRVLRDRNPLVNSYMPGPGYEAPTSIACPKRTESARACAGRTRHGHPHRAAHARPRVQPLSHAGVMLDRLTASRKMIGPPINKNIYRMSHQERRHLRIDELPANLEGALGELEKDELVRHAHEHTVEHFIAAKAKSGSTTAGVAMGDRSVPRNARPGNVRLVWCPLPRDAELP